MTEKMSRQEEHNYSSSAVNPTLTIIANALRVADHLRHRLGSSE